MLAHGGSLSTQHARVYWQAFSFWKKRALTKRSHPPLCALDALCGTSQPNKKCRPHPWARILQGGMLVRTRDGPKTHVAWPAMCTHSFCSSIHGFVSFCSHLLLLLYSPPSFLPPSSIVEIQIWRYRAAAVASPVRFAPRFFCREKALAPLFSRRIVFTHAIVQRTVK